MPLRDLGPTSLPKDSTLNYTLLMRHSSPSTKSINLSSIRLSIYISQSLLPLGKTILAHLFTMEKTRSYTSRCGLKKKPPKSKFSKPFSIVSTIFKTIYQVCQLHCTYQVKAWKIGP